MKIFQKLKFSFIPRNIVVFKIMLVLLNENWMYHENKPLRTNQIEDLFWELSWKAHPNPYLKDYPLLSLSVYMSEARA